MEKLACMFPGQGSQYVGMGQNFYSYSTYNKTLEKAIAFLGEDFGSVLCNGPLESLSETRYTQPLVYAVSCGIFYTLMERYSLKPVMMAGHSLGEITALTCAGAIKFEDGLKIVKKRGELMTVGPIGGMAAIMGLSEEEVTQICSQSTTEGETIVPANINSSRQIVVSGTAKALSQVRLLTEAKRGRFIPLKVSAPFHSPFMKPVADSFKEELLKYTFRKPEIPVISNVDAQFYVSPAEIPERLTQQLVNPVLWKQTMDLLDREQIDCCLEIGPKNVLKGLLSGEKKKIHTFAADEQEDFRQLDLHILNYQRTLELCIKHSITIKNNNPDPDVYERDVRIPLKNMISRYYGLLDGKLVPDEELISQGIHMAMKIFEAKQTPDHEQELRLKEILNSIRDKTLLEKFRDIEVAHE